MSGKKPAFKNPKNLRSQQNIPTNNYTTERNVFNAFGEVQKYLENPKKKGMTQRGEDRRTVMEEGQVTQAWMDEVYLDIWKLRSRTSQEKGILTKAGTIWLCQKGNDSTGSLEHREFVVILKEQGLKGSDKQTRDVGLQETDYQGKG